MRWKDIEALKGFQVPRVHGNGHIQLDLDDTRRLNVWGDPRIPRQRVAHPIHNHAFDFNSKVLKGRLVNVVYNVCTSHGDFYHARYIRHQATPSKGHDTILSPVSPDPFCNIASRYTQSVQEGQSYFLGSWNFHEILVPEVSISLMRKDPVLRLPGEKPTVLVLEGRLADNEFTRDHDPDFLWTIIEEAFYA